MKHVVKALSHQVFCDLYASLLEKLRETGERIERAKFKMNDASVLLAPEFKAVIWTKRKKKGTP